MSISRITPHASIAGFTAANSFSNNAEQLVLVQAKRGSSVQVFKSTDGAVNWVPVITIDATGGSEVSTINVGSDVTHLNAVSTTTKKVRFKAMPQGLVPSWESEGQLSSQGNYSLTAISASEKSAVDNRISAIEAKALSGRSPVTLSGDDGRSAGAFFDAGTSFANIRDKSFMIFVNGEVVHGDDYTVHDDNDGKIAFNFDLGDNAELDIFVWE